MKDEDVTNKKGEYLYLLNGKEKYLNIRTFDNRQKKETYTRQAGICPSCKEEFKIEELEADHIIPCIWEEKLYQRTVKCYAKSAIGESLENKSI